jgi:hypothetical protein
VRHKALLNEPSALGTFLALQESMTAPLVFRRAFPFVVLSLLAVAAYLQARGLVQLLALALGLGDPIPSAGWARRRSVPPDEPRKSGRTVLERSPFDSPTGSLLPHESALARGSLGVSADPLAWPACEGGEVVIVTESPVMVADFGARGERAPVAPPPGWRLARRQATGVEAASSNILARAERIGGGVRSVRVVPEQLGGKVVGLRLFNVRSDSLLGSIGVKSGDRLESINGLSVASPQKALETSAQLRRASRLEVHLVRAGSPLDLTLNIH